MLALSALAWPFTLSSHHCLLSDLSDKTFFALADSPRIQTSFWHHSLPLAANSSSLLRHLSRSSRSWPDKCIASRTGMPGSPTLAARALMPD